MSDLIWVQTVCKGNQQTTKVAASTERVKTVRCIFSARDRRNFEISNYEVSVVSYKKKSRLTLTFPHIRRVGPFFWFKILNFNILEGFQKN